jgi:hypothetical protein
MTCGVCHNCVKMGQFIHEWWSKKKNGEAHAAQEEEASLLLATGGAVQMLPPPPPPPAAPLQILAESGALYGPCVEDGLAWGRSVKGARPVGVAVHLMEEKVFAHLGDAKEKYCRWWVLDTGAMNHMIGCRSAFSDLDRNIHDIVRFKIAWWCRSKGWVQFCSMARMGSTGCSPAFTSFPG